MAFIPRALLHVNVETGSKIMTRDSSFVAFVNPQGRRAYTILSVTMDFTNGVKTELNKIKCDNVSFLPPKQRAGVPLFSITNSPDDIRLQMYILDFIQRLEHSPS